MKTAAYLIPAACLFLASCSNKPTAEFLPSSSLVEVGEVVSFTDQSENGTHYVWDFGDGSPQSTHPNPTHVYEAAGDYSVSLQVYDKKYRNASDYSEVITVNAAPLSTQEQLEADRQAVFADLHGQWSYDRNAFEVYRNDVFDPQQSWEQEFSNSAIDVFSEDMLMRTHEFGQEQLEQYQVIGSDRIQLSWQVFDIILLGPNDFIVKATQTFEDFNGDIIRQETSQYYSR